MKKSVGLFTKNISELLTDKCNTPKYKQYNNRYFTIGFSFFSYFKLDQRLEKFLDSQNLLCLKFSIKFFRCILNLFRGLFLLRGTQLENIYARSIELSQVESEPVFRGEKSGSKNFPRKC
jgi:hypothetical protein